MDRQQAAVRPSDCLFLSGEDRRLPGTLCRQRRRARHPGPATRNSLRLLPAPHRDLANPLRRSRVAEALVCRPAGFSCRTERRSRSTRRSRPPTTRIRTEPTFSSCAGRVTEASCDSGRLTGHMSTPCGIHDPIHPKASPNEWTSWKLRTGTQFLLLEYEEAMARAKPGDLIYCDPPYSNTHGHSLRRPVLRLARPFSGHRGLQVQGGLCSFEHRRNEEIRQAQGRSASAARFVRTGGFHRLRPVDAAAFPDGWGRRWSKNASRIAYCSPTRLKTICSSTERAIPRQEQESDRQVLSRTKLRPHGGCR